MQRNRVFGIVSSMALVAFFAVALNRGALADPCPSGRARCFGTCCGEGQVCVNKGAGASCQCPTGSFLCNGQCVQSSNTNCGVCGNVCPDNATCVNGVCQCGAGTISCGGHCVSTACDAGEVFNATTCACEPGASGCTPNGSLCTSKNECCSPTAKCSPNNEGRKVCHD